MKKIKIPVVLLVLVICICISLTSGVFKKNDNKQENQNTVKEETQVDLSKLDKYIGEKISNEDAAELIEIIRRDYEQYLNNSSETGKANSAEIIIYFDLNPAEDNVVKESILDMIDSYMETREKDKDYGYFKITQGVDEKYGQYIDIEKIREMTNEQLESVVGYEEKDSILDSIEITDIDGTNYKFEYNNETFNVQYTTDNWKIIDSYKKTNKKDMIVICQKLIEIHPIHGADMQSFRTPEDMAEEWLAHNLAYKILPETSKWKANVKDVDLDPKDQGKSLFEMYKERTGKEFSLESLSE